MVKPTIALITAVWKRPELTGLVLNRFKNIKFELSNKINLELIAVGSEGDVSRRLCESRGFFYVEYENVQQTLPDLRLHETKIASELQRNSINLDNQEKEIERANSAVEEIQIRVEDNLDDTLFSQPLTIELDAPEEWVGANIEIISDTTETRQVHPNDTKLYFNTIPNGEITRLVKVDVEGSFSSPFSFSPSLSFMDE